MLDRVNKVTTHVDLDSADATTQEHEPDAEAIWAQNCSAKFKFLHFLFKATRLHDIHIAVVARSGRLLDILETFLKGHQVVYNRPDTVSRSDSNLARGLLQVTLLASGQEGASYLPKPAKLVIAFDGSFNAKDPQVGLLRGHLLNVHQLAPVIHLLVYSSAEHIERCIPESTEPIERTRRIVSCMTQTRHEVGQLTADELGAAGAAEEVAAFLEAGGLEPDWTVPAIRAIDGLNVIESQDSESTNQSDEQARSDIPNTEYSSSTLKRALVRTPSFAFLVHFTVEHS